MGDAILDLPVLSRVGLAAPVRRGRTSALASLGEPVPGSSGADAGVDRVILRRRALGVARSRTTCPGQDQQAMSCYAPLLAALFALLRRLTIGKAWERYKLRDGKWIRPAPGHESSPLRHLGLIFSSPTRIDLAIEELRPRREPDADALEVHMILGNCTGKRDRSARRSRSHQNLLSARKLMRSEHAYVLLCLASTTNAAASSIARSKPSTRSCASIRERVRPAQPAEAPRGTARVDRGLRHAAAIVQARGHRRAPAQPGDSRVLEKRDRLEAMRRKDYREATPPLQLRDRPSTRGRCLPI